MRERLLVSGMLLALLGPLIASCDEKATPIEIGVSSDGKTSKPVDSEATSDGIDTSDPVSTEDGGNATPHRSPYICDRDGGKVVRPKPEDDYEKPETLSFDTAKTRSEIISDLGGELPEAARLLGAAARLQAEKNPNMRVLYAHEDEDLLLHFGTIAGVDNFGDSKVALSVVVNYEPVEATFKHWSPDRETILEQKTGSGAEFPIDDDVELIDIHIDGDRLTDGQMFDLGIGSVVTGKVKLSNSYRRIRVFQGGNRRPEHPCLHVGEKNRSRTDRESELYKAARFSDLVIDSRTSEDWVPSDPPIPAHRGETVTIDYTLFTAVSDHFEAYALVPFLDEEALDWRRFYAVPVDHQLNASVRGSLTVTLPNEPGIYKIRMGSYRNPFLTPGDQPPKDIQVDGTPGDGSNAIRFEIAAE